MSTSADIPSKTRLSHQPSAIRAVLSLPPQWLQMYDEFITKNASQVSQIESALRSLTYIIPGQNPFGSIHRRLLQSNHVATGRFRDAEIASETLHSSVQLLSLYHDTLLMRALSRIPMTRLPSPHSRYTKHWTQHSPMYRRIAMLLQMVTYTELLCEMAAKRRGGERGRWRVVVLLEAIKAICRLLLLRVTRSRPLVTPVLPEREPIPEEPDNDADVALNEMLNENSNGHAPDGGDEAPKPHEKEWTMPRTGMSLPSLPKAGDISSYLLGKVLTADDIKPAAKLLNQLQGSAHAAEILHILAPLVYAVALSRSKNKKSWTPWLVGLSVEYAARQLRDRSFRTTPLERDEWAKRGWAMGWWTMRGAFYENVMKGVVGGVRSRVPGLIGGILEDYEYLWENYYFSTSA
ncbi:Peroxisomal membrane protein PEX16 [Colletotrichum chlorophyti]|uniref:Peroxisomal membrane protein PEX16 n=1 Tax=Colletotrichum chlorophyti TaxID=708187 RepID=A0A1Q8S0F9_9PEZI|nr:Peroxisomal membrane protein PEX16 [Colletotrichum chlorophyti]